MGMIFCKRKRLVGSFVILRGYDTYLFMDVPICHIFIFTQNSLEQKSV